MRIKKNNKKNKLHSESTLTKELQESLPLTGIDKALDQHTSVWKILVSFILLTSMFIVAIDYYQLDNHNNIKDIYDKRQQALLSAYQLQTNFNNFKADPDKFSFSLIQQTVNLDSSIKIINKADPSFNTKATNILNKDIEQIVSEVPSIKLFQQNIDTAYRKINSIKYKIINEFDNQTSKKDIKRNLYTTTDKIEYLLLQVKSNYLITQKTLETYQRTIEEIGQDIEQYNNYLFTGELSNNFNSMIKGIEEIFTDLAGMMPIVLNLANMTVNLEKVASTQQEIINELKNHEIKYIDGIDDKSIIIGVIIFTNLLFISLVLFSKLFDGTRNVYKKIKAKKEDKAKEVFYLSHTKDISNDYTNLEKTSEKCNNPGHIAAIDSIYNINFAQQEIKLLLEAKTKIVNDSYILLDNVDKFETLYLKKSNSVKLQGNTNLSKQILSVISRVAQQIAANVTLLDQSIKHVLSVDNKLDMKEKVENKSEESVV